MSEICDSHLFLDNKIISKEIDNISYFFTSFYLNKNTQNIYKNDLKEFFNFCFETLQIRIISFDQITERLILIWKNKLTDYSPATQARKLSALSSFLEFARKENATRFIQKPKASLKGKTNALTYDEVIKILKFMEREIEKDRILQKERYKTWKLRYATLYTLFTVGMRVSELCTLRIKSLKNMGNYWKLEMQAKGNETHSPVIHENTAKVLLEYKNEFRKDASENDYFFVRVRTPGTQLHRSSVFDMIKIAAQSAGIEKKISPHSCRATLATLLHHKGVPLLKIQNLLNHKQITTTSIYVKKAEEIAQAAAYQIDFLKDE